MSMIYSDPTRETEPAALPNVEVWEHVHGRVNGKRVRACEEPHCSGDDGDEECRGDGWYWWTCFPGCLPDSEPNGPFETEAEAVADAQDSE